MFYILYINHLKKNLKGYKQNSLIMNEKPILLFTTVMSMGIHKLVRFNLSLAYRSQYVRFLFKPMLLEFWFPIWIDIVDKYVDRMVLNLVVDVA